MLRMLLIGLLAFSSTFVLAEAPMVVFLPPSDAEIAALSKPDLRLDCSPSPPTTKSRA